MTKKNKIGKIYKILPLKEALSKGEITKDEFESYLGKQIIQFSGMEDIDEKVKSEIINTLKGIKGLSDEVTVKEVKGSILRLTNMIDRSE